MDFKNCEIRNVKLGALNILIKWQGHCSGILASLVCHIGGVYTSALIRLIYVPALISCLSVLCLQLQLFQRTFVLYGTVINLLFYLLEAVSLFRGCNNCCGDTSHLVMNH